ncbi:hypothetical protein RvY_14471 [Ramazzottius varieornatus]|uniref:Large ribosomal subunit protein bL36m n=1 Tax=Ramazzottius varieornatus TaxID=947166 RepID=A0A1D1VZV3_RAMVA|nr:hypothetical protein RvY_14471 [Ramazzottius varieornatus]
MSILNLGRQAVLRTLAFAFPRPPSLLPPSIAICSAVSPPTVVWPTAPSLWGVAPCRTYVVRDILTLRCDGCYFAKRQGIRYVECRLRPRHKQKQKIRTKHWCWSNWNLRNVW